MKKFIVGLVAATGIFSLVLLVQSVRKVSLREAMLYQGYLPTDRRTSDFEVGNVVVLNLVERSIEAIGKHPCGESEEGLFEPKIRNSSYALSGGSFVDFVWKESAERRETNQLDMKVWAIDPIAYLNGSFSVNKDCESNLRSFVGSNCLVIVKSAVFLDEKFVGFDISEKCQIINVTLEPVILGQLMTASYFDGVFGVSIFERLWISATRPFVGVRATMSN